MKTGAAILIIKDGLILAISRRRDHTKFGFIGGKNDEGETLKETAIRECFEETSIEIKDCIEFFKKEEAPITQDDEWFLTHCFYAIEWEGIPKSSEEGIVKWMQGKNLIKGDSAAFPIYNQEALEEFKKLYPNVKLK